MAGPVDPPDPFAQISAEFARLHASARRMLWVAPAQTLIDLRACGVVLVHRILDGCDHDPRADLGGLLEHPMLRRRVPLAQWVHLDWLRRKGNIAAHPEEQKADAAALDRFAREGLEYAHGLAVWFCGTRLGVVADALPAFELPPEVTLDRVCGDAIVRDEREAVYFLGTHYKRLAAEARAEKADDRYSGLVNPSYPHEVDAVYWFTRASRRHLHAGAMYELGLAKLHGHGCKQDIDEALALIDSAAHYDHADAQHRYAVYLLEGHVEGLRDIPRDYEAARALLEQAARHDHPGAFNCLMKIYSEGLGVPPDPARALELARRSADAGYPLAQLNLATMYLNERIPERRPGEAVELLRAAAAAEIPYALTMLHALHRHGARVERDDVRAFEYLERAAALADPQARILLACACRDGDHVAADLHRAIHLLLSVQRTPRLTEGQQQRAGHELGVALALLRAVITKRMVRSVKGQLDFTEAGQMQEDFLLLYQNVTAMVEDPGNPWAALADRGLAGVKLLHDAIVWLRATPDRLPPELRAELLRVLPGLDLEQFRRPPPPPPARAPMVRTTPKVGRNDPCTCGSGRKYKRCCGAPA